MLDKINQFFESITDSPIELYSEFGLQHELAIFLRSNFEDLTVRLEYPTPRIFNPHPDLVKKEIDIYVTNREGEKFVIEIKMPKNDSGIPNQMYEAVKDVKFLEQMKQNNINGCYAILMTSHTSFWQAPQANAGIYQFFNGEQINIQSLYQNHVPAFLQEKDEIRLHRNYSTTWCNYVDVHNINWKYYVLEM